MKIVTLLTAALFLVFTPVMADTIVVKTAGMMCESCAATITQGFEGQAGVNDIQIDLEKQLVTIDVDSVDNLSDEVIEKNLIDRDYEFVSVKRVKD